MKALAFVAMVIATITSIPLLAQQVSGSGSANDSAKTTYTAATGGFGDQAASHAWEMSSVTGELDGKLDSKTARVGDRVVLKTTQKVQTSDGTVIPKGSRLVGHVTAVQAYSKEHGAAQMGIAFDRAELKNGQSIAVHTLIRGVNPSASALDADAMNDDAMMGQPMGGSMGGNGRMGAGPAMGSGRAGGGLLGGAGGAVSGVGGVAGDTLDRTGDAASSVSEQAGAGLGSTANAAVETAGHSDLNVDAGAHDVAAARAVPHATGIPGVMLAGSGSASGVFSASRKNVELESGTEIQLGIVADR